MRHFEINSAQTPATAPRTLAHYTTATSIFDAGNEKPKCADHLSTLRKQALDNYLTLTKVSLRLRGKTRLTCVRVNRTKQPRELQFSTNPATNWPSWKVTSGTGSPLMTRLRRSVRSSLPLFSPSTVTYGAPSNGCDESYVACFDLTATTSCPIITRK